MYHHGSSGIYPPMMAAQQQPGWANNQPSKIQWIPMSNGAHPPFALQAGVDSGRELYVARAYHAGGMIPGKLHVGHNSAYIAYGGKEVPVANYEVLVAPIASLSWVEGRGGNIPPYAVPGGTDPNGDTYYIGRVCMNGTVTVGKVHGRYESCFVPYGGSEHAKSTYEILVKNALGRTLNV